MHTTGPHPGSAHEHAIPAGTRARLYVLAGPNGAGKSSLAGATFRKRGADYFNPDEAAAAIRRQRPALGQTQANSAAWQQGKRLLEEAIAKRMDYALETTLGGSSIVGLIEDAAALGFEVRVWYAALASPELHLARVHARVARGGHDIPENDVRRRYDSSRMNLIRLLPCLTELRMFDNSHDADPWAGQRPQPLLVLHWQDDRVVAPADLGMTPNWAKPIVMAALRLQATRGSLDTGAQPAPSP